MSPKLDPKGRSRKQIYATERQNILDQLYIIIGVTDENRICFIDDLEKDLEKQERIMALVPDIRQYFGTSKWSIFAKPDNVDRKYWSLVKYVVRDMGFAVTTISERSIDKKTRCGIRIQ